MLAGNIFLQFSDTYFSHAVKDLAIMSLGPLKRPLLSEWRTFRPQASGYGRAKPGSLASLGPQL